jgi:hypothetical protein
VSAPPAGATKAHSTGAASSSAAGDEPLLPATYHENDLRSVVGASPIDRKHDRKHDDDASPSPRNRKTIVVSVLGIVAGLVIAGLVFLGHANRDRYLLACEAARVVPEQGRAFPPWGTHALEGEAWKPLKITPETRCQPHETDDPLALERLYLAMILDQVTGLLTAREVTKLDEAEALLTQALLLTRPPEQEPEKLANERNEHHKEIERMRGDVTYWRAAARLRDAATALADAAKQFDSAAAQHPRHVSDASAWAAYARRLAQELHAGPAEAAPSTPTTSPPVSAAPPTVPPTPPAISPPVPPIERPTVPAGVALPVEPATGSAGEPPPAPGPPDAGVPTGGVLL